MKTGTPVSVDGRSLDFSKMEEQKGDEKPGKFSFIGQLHIWVNKRSCFLAYTNIEVHDILRKGFAGHLYSQEGFLEKDQDIVLLLKIKLNAFRQKNGINFLLNRKDGIQSNIM